MQIIYIAGNGHSGSTLLDMILGSTEDSFSGGELTHISRDSILQEYCSCGEIIDDCRVWRDVMAKWSSSRSISAASYRELRLRYERNKTLFRLVFNLISPSKEFLLYCLATQALFDAIQKTTGAQVIIDSSKSAARILILRQFASLKVVHLTRNFTGVMNSVNRFSPKNLEKGIEVDLYPTPPHRALVTWVLNNFLVLLCSIGLKRHQVQYRQLVRKPDELFEKLGKDFDKSTDTRFSPEHMLAGNVIRLRKDLALNPDIGFTYRNLSKNQLRFGAIVDRLFWFWS